MAGPPGGVRSSLAGLVSSMTAPFRGRNQTKSKGAPILSNYGGAGNWTPGIGNMPDLSQFDQVFQPGNLFSPGRPLVPVERERARRWDYPTGYNYIYTPRSFEPVSFPELRALAQETLTRLAIETRKDQIEALDWSIKPTNEKQPKSDAPARIKKLMQFFAKPDGYHPFASWLRMLIEDVLVTDAPAVELRFNRGGDIIALDYIDGATLKVLINETGRRPLPPAPAYEQIIHGRPWVLAEEGRIETDARGKPLWDSQIIYMPRNVRGSRPYGFPPVEQILITVNTSLRRQIMQLQHFTEGNVPVGMINGEETWTTEQATQWTDWWNSILAGNTAEKTRILIGPPNAKFQAFKEPPYKDQFDEWLARIVCFAFSLPPSAFVQQMNRATAQTAQETALEEGLAPLMFWAKRLLDTVIQDRMGHTDLEFAWADKKTVDASDEAVILTGYVKDGIYTLNEARDILGMDPVEGGDEPMFLTAQGPVLLRDAAAMSAQQANPPPPPQPGIMGGAGGRPGAKPSPGKTEDGPAPAGRNGKSPGNAKPAAGKKEQPANDRKPQSGNAKTQKIASLGIALALEKGHVDPENAVPVGFPLADPVAEADVEHSAWQLVIDGNPHLEERTVAVGNLRAMQRVVDRERVARDEVAYRQGGQDALDFLPLVFERDGLAYVLRGHHHCQAVINAGAAELRVQVITPQSD